MAHLPAAVRVRLRIDMGVLGKDRAMTPTRARAWLNLMQSLDTARWFRGRTIEAIRWKESWP